MEGKEFKVSKGVAYMSRLVKNMICLGCIKFYDEADDEADVNVPLEEDIKVPLPLVKNDILEKVIEFCKKHEKSPMAEIDKPLKSSNMSENVDEWDAKFIDQPQDIIFELLNAANYMDIKSLLDLCCGKVASIMKDKTSDEICRTFNIVDDLSKEEKEKFREEDGWCDDK
jgi:S-phase kinase-associated protein 1